MITNNHTNESNLIACYKLDIFRGFIFSSAHNDPMGFSWSFYTITTAPQGSRGGILMFSFEGFPLLPEIPVFLVENNHEILTKKHQASSQTNR